MKKAQVLRAAAVDLLVFAVAVTSMLVTESVLKPPAKFEWLITDFPGYYAAGRLAAEGRAGDTYRYDILERTQHEYFPQMGDRFVRLANPPVLLPFLEPLAAFSPERALQVWNSILIGSFALSLVIFSRVYKLPLPAILAIGVLVPWSGAMWETMRHSKPAPIILLGVALHLLGMQRKNRILAAFGTSLWFIKPDLMLAFWVFLAGQGEWRVLGLVFALGVASLLLLLAVCGFDCVSSYLHLASTLAGDAPLAGGLPTVIGQLFQFEMIPKHTATVIAEIVFLLGLGFVFYCGRRFRGNPNALHYGIIASVPCCTGLSLYALNYDFLLFVPLMLSLVSSGMLHKLHFLLKACAIVGLTILFFPIYPILHYLWVLKGGTVNPFFVLNLFFVALSWRLTANTEKSIVAEV